MSLVLSNDFGEVAIDGPARQAIEMIQDMAYSLQMTPSEFMDIFNEGIPECPCCVKEKAQA